VVLVRNRGALLRDESTDIGGIPYDTRDCVRIPVYLPAADILAFSVTPVSV